MKLITKKFTAATLLFGFCTISNFAQSEENHPKTIKRAHQHDAMADGKVMMSGDTHMELIRTGAESVNVYFSDKFRNPMAANLFDIKIHLNSIGKKQLLNFVIDSKKSNKILVKLPAKLAKGDELELSAPLRVAQKAYVSVATPVKILLNQIPEKKNDSMDAHMGDHGDEHGEHH